MSYQVHITSTAEHDIMRAADYIEFTLKNPDAADNLLDAATEQISSLADLPQKFRLVDNTVLSCKESVCMQVPFLCNLFYLIRHNLLVCHV